MPATTACTEAAQRTFTAAAATIPSDVGVGNNNVAGGDRERTRFTGTGNRHHYRRSGNDSINTGNAATDSERRSRDDTITVGTAF
jgi:hypothetical protein